ncbi:hypothetical protein H257_00601 [Aphanomyces astaci]|uniref:RNA-dependent RNA polymerase n=2 Tax=Aphanomyces astaci TaxID=112090 RepID=W4HD64_APHAT|nr:hypothetical protein H257_00601 [Aphanomyces astaci]ETV89244.1 hypothetical protein H257_00601 [Aphanomyces astaci]|eukprot:XP_009821644.1 hypothetical protein H257_00601 [Aphanomyces astaci]
MNRDEFNAARKQYKDEADEDLNRKMNGHLPHSSPILSACVSNLKFEVTSTRLHQFLEANGIFSITKCKVKIENGRSVGRATVTVASSSDMDKLLGLNDVRFFSRPMRVQIDRKSVPILSRWNGTSMSVGTLPDASDEFRPYWTTSSNMALEITERGKHVLAMEFAKSRRIEFKVRDVVRCCVHAAATDDDGCSLWFHVRRPPMCFQKVGLHLFKDDDDDWVRSTDPSGASVFGQCFAYAVELPMSRALVSTTLQRYGVKATKHCTYHKPVVPGIPPEQVLGKWSGGDDRRFANVPWTVRYALHVLVVQRKIDFLDAAFATHVATACATSKVPPAVLSHHLVALRVFPRRSIADKLLALLDPSTPLPSTPTGHTIRRVLVTPLRVVPEAPEADQTNRVLRQYGHLVDRFLRVTFVDENFASIFNVNRSPYVFDRIRQLVRTGLNVSGDQFDFLAYSNSQLRSQSCWFFKSATDGEAGIPSVDEIRRSLGSFQAIAVPGRRGARIGQAFSSTTPTLDVPAHRVRVQADIERHGYTFSDGVGYMSPSFAERVATFMRVGCVPSALQIRYGGAKGVVSVMPTPLDVDMVLRKSMVKFASDHTGLEICNVAAATPFYLNRQVIPLLSCLGVHDASVMALLNDMLESMASSASTAADAIVLFEKHAPLDPPLRLLKAGCTLDDPFVFEWTQSLRRRLSLDLQLKARILVPRAVCLMGVLDETHSLEEGQVFFQTRSNRYEVPPTGALLAVGRCPCLHPGDIRLMRRAHVPRLGHLYDVLVFSSNGGRPDPNKMSGGDLDGDIYFVLWDKSLLPTHEYPPMLYDPPTPNHASTGGSALSHSDQVAEFFVEYMRNDNLGQISSAHLVFTDMTDAGAKSDECLELAEQASVAVDYAKTGVSVQGRIRSSPVYPDFMENATKASYQSDKILGQVYRRAKHANPPSMSHCTWRHDARLVVPGHEAYMNDADDQCFAYSTELWDIACKYHVHSEIELISGNVRSLSRQICRRKGLKASKDVSDRLQLVVRQVRTKYEAKFWAEFGNDVNDPRALQKASAWYYTAYTYEWEHGDPPYLSFGWLALAPMCRLLELACSP